MNVVVVQDIESGADHQRAERPHHLFRAGADNGPDAVDRWDAILNTRYVKESKWPSRGNRQGDYFMADSDIWRSKGLSIMVQKIVVSASTSPAKRPIPLAFSASGEAVVNCHQVANRFAAAPHPGR